MKQSWQLVRKSMDTQNYHAHMGIETRIRMRMSTGTFFLTTLDLESRDWIPIIHVEKFSLKQLSPVHGSSNNSTEAARLTLPMPPFTGPHILETRFRYSKTR
ncbi:hypothetical protein PVL29_026050 [Vitis rotundifolia]|uniref:Uncharacterized protein n=1 Tax=Vitis rotundifolia TaxID=103349 RepID=A0AA38YLI3_VITRO|nr:hypothetical protein PVL29_026050 [Vitis rotundifolia]